MLARRLGASGQWLGTGGTRARLTEAEFLDLIGAIYEVALTPQDLPDMLSRLARLVGALWSPMSVVPLTGGTTVSLHNAEGDPSHLALFNGKYVTPERNPATPLLMASRPGQIVQREHYFTNSDWQHTEVYQEVYRPIGADASLGVVLVKSREHFVPLGLMRPKSLGPFEAHDLALIGRVVPHLGRMMQILLRLNDLGARAVANAELWGRLPYGVVLLDETGRLVWANGLAELLLSEGDSLGSRDGRLYAANPGENAVLQKLIKSAAATGSGDGVGSGGGVALSRVSGARPLSVLVAPLRIDKGTVVLSRRAMVAVFVNDPERDAVPPLQRLAQQYRLTPREAAVAGLLLQGMGLRDAADRLGIGFNTARTHLRQVLEKTGTHRQAELVSLLLRSIVVLDEGRG